MVRLLELFIIVRIKTVIMYAIGSLLPLSISKSEAKDPFKFKRCALNTAKTDAASVEETTAPINKPSNNVVFITK